MVFGKIKTVLLSSDPMTNPLSKYFLLPSFPSILNRSTLTLSELSMQMQDETH